VCWQRVWLAARGAPVERMRRSTPHGLTGLWMKRNVAHWRDDGWSLSVTKQNAWVEELIPWPTNRHPPGLTRYMEGERAQLRARSRRDRINCRTATSQVRHAWLARINHLAKTLPRHYISSFPLPGGSFTGVDNYRQPPATGPAKPHRAVHARSWLTTGKRLLSSSQAAAFITHRTGRVTALIAELSVLWSQEDGEPSSCEQR